MKSNHFILVVIVLSVVLTLSASLSAAQGPAPQDGAQPQATLGSAFTYQGQLVQGDNPVNGTYSMAFSLYDAASGGNLVAGPLNEDVDVTDGLFTVLLDFGAAFTGDARWLEIAVEGETLSPRQALTAAPYALSLRPGATILGAVSDGAILYAYNIDTEASLYAYGLMGQVSSTKGYGVYGHANAFSGATYGVFGQADSPAGTGVRGDATATSGETYGVYGQTDSPDGRGVAGYAGAASGDTRGVYGRSESPDGAGVYGLSSAATGDGSGVYGKSYSASGYGVTGANDSGSGVYGWSYSGVGVRAFSEDGVAVRAERPDYISGNLIEAWAGLMPPDLEFRVDCYGNVTADGTYSTPAADFAEMLPAVDGLEPGDVLVIGLDGQLARSSEAYQPTVVGVYSAQPGFLGGAGNDEDLEGQIPLAIVGIVPVKVTAENGSIAPGDLLVTSSTPGYAMRAGESPLPGTVIGKAMDALESGNGVIQMLVMLR